MEHRGKQEQPGYAHYSKGSGNGKAIPNRIAVTPIPTPRAQRNCIHGDDSAAKFLQMGKENLDELERRMEEVKRNFQGAEMSA